MGQSMTRSNRPPAPTSESLTRHEGERPIEVHGSLTLGDVFTPPEADMVRTVRDFAQRAAGYTQDLERALDCGLQSLATLALALESYPSLKTRHVLGTKERSLDTLMRSLVEGGEHALEWGLPTKAILARSYGIAKVHFFTSLRYVVEACEGEEAKALRKRVTDAIEEAVYTRLAEELYASFIGSKTMTKQVKELAAEHVIDLWEGRTRLVTSRFCPLLRSAWSARLRAPRVFGTLRGTQELVQLLFEDCDQEFIEFFVRHEHGSEPRQAFEEFLFDLPFESLERVRRRMREEGKAVVGPREVEMYLGFGEGKLRPIVGGTRSLYASFRSRRVKAQYRASMGVPGPKRTAEAYVLEALLQRELDREEPLGGDGV
jgi:hypothetical protein